MGAGGAPMVVLPSVNRTMILALGEAGSNSWVALAKASAWLVLPPAVRPSTAVFRASTEVVSWVLATAVLEKLTTPIRLPEPIWPSLVLSVASSMRSIKVLAPSFKFASGLPVMLPERSRTRTISVGLETMSGAAVSARVTRRAPSQRMRSVLMTLLEFVTPMCVTSFWGNISLHTMHAPGKLPLICRFSGRRKRHRG